MSSQLLPDPTLLNKLLDDETVSDPQGLMERQYITGTSVTLAEDIVWPVPKECFQLNVVLQTKKDVQGWRILAILTEENNPHGLGRYLQALYKRTVKQMCQKGFIKIAAEVMVDTKCQLNN